jgi:hypothetical protein
MWRLSGLIVPSSAVPLHIYMYFVLLDRVSACSVLSLERFNYIYVCTRYPDYTSHPLTSVIDPLNLSIPSTFDFEVRYFLKPRPVQALIQKEKHKVIWCNRPQILHNTAWSKDILYEQRYIQNDPVLFWACRFKSTRVPPRPVSNDLFNALRSGYPTL